MRGRRGTRSIAKRLPLVLALGLVLVLVAGGGFAALESRTVSSYWEGVWWALSLTTTVGFVGESPETTAGQILSAVLMIFGFGLLTLTTAAVASLFVREEEEPVEEREHAFELMVAGRLDELSARLARIESAIGAPPEPGGRPDDTAD